jgi:cyclophilin family peptidyl-prolyl cis-trans isomerase
MLFQRVIKHYVIQAGDGQGTGAADWNLRGKQPARFSYSFGFLQSILVMIQ